MSGWVRFENTTLGTLALKAKRRGCRPITGDAFMSWFAAIEWCSQHESDGAIPATELRRVCVGRVATVIGALIALGLIEEDADGDFTVHDYLDYNPSREKIESLKARSRRTTRSWRDKNVADHNSGGDASQTGHAGKCDVSPIDHPRGRDRSVPERVVVSSLDSASNLPSSQDKNNQVQGRTARGRETMRPSSDVLSLCNRLASLISLNDPKADPQSRSERWLTDMRLLLADRNGDIEEVRAVIEWCQRDSFWRSNILSPGKLRKQFTQLKLRMDGDDNGGQGGVRRLPTPRPESPSEMLIALNGGQI